MRKIRSKVGLVSGCCALVFSVALCARADQVNMHNGERYVGKVVTFSNETVVVQSDVLGTLHVPRSKIVSIVFGTNVVATPVQTPVATAAQPPKSPAPSASANADLTTAIQQLRADTNATRRIQQQVQQQFLTGADPQATEMFNQMMGGLMNGSLNVEDIRVKAKSAADQLRVAKKEFGDEAGFAIDGYLAVLDGFLRETAPPSGGSPTNALASSVKPKRSQLVEDE
jgi:hypothetical protein